jgi:DNA-binding beta-propeller fold protein YncE
MALAMTPDGRTLYVAVGGGNVVLPVDVATGHPGTPIKTVAPSPVALAMAPDGRILYVACDGSFNRRGNQLDNVVLPVDVATGRRAGLIRVGKGPDALAIAPDGRTLYAAITGGNAVTPVDTATGRVGARIQQGINDPLALVVTRNGRTLYVADAQESSVTPVALRG